MVSSRRDIFVSGWTKWVLRNVWGVGSCSISVRWEVPVSVVKLEKVRKVVEVVVSCLLSVIWVGASLLKRVEPFVELESTVIEC